MVFSSGSLPTAYSRRSVSDTLDPSFSRLDLVSEMFATGLLVESVHLTLLPYPFPGDSMLVIFFTNTLTAILPAYMATFGPALGLRQMTSARYSWGWHGAKVVALLNW